ncbi:hypothetical protein H634G_04365 [Metarhizium anisopliae BRIP 53293]|uniref:Uncharacterized protein n=1 Tax=Metarhizium anisopliae BRIP 53293 TaxID=1291518 RepID=A0A0D9P214_METAN|nr:hypothetical protein H634G_04365 [Metarhizium anisopliae BRIP 53293]KJK92876.1 hypothetical protein H633G_03252 [Metarhizium anisopliae BRIP 53284]
MKDPASCAAPSSSPPPTAAESSSSGPTTSRYTYLSEAATENPILRLRPPRTLPPWIDSYEERYGPVSDEQLRLLQPPARIVQHQTNFSPNPPQRRVSKDGFVAWDDPSLGPAQTSRAKIPHFLRYGRASMRGRKWDHLRSNEPVIVSHYRPAPTQSKSSWFDFVRSSAWGRMPNEESQVVDHHVLDQLQPTFNKEMDVQFHITDVRVKDHRKLATLPRHMWNRIMRHPLSPFLFRLGVMVTSILALGIAARIYQLENNMNQKNSAERAQVVVAIVVDCLAIPYIGYMIWDEYTGKPLGLRSAMSKISLILLDLFFIIFKSASTALAFESFIYHNVRQNQLVHLSVALAVFQLIGLCSWSMTFTINIFRTVKRLGGGGDDNDGSGV